MYGDVCLVFSFINKKTEKNKAKRPRRYELKTAPNEVSKTNERQKPSVYVKPSNKCVRILLSVSE